MGKIRATHSEAACLCLSFVLDFSERAYSELYLLDPSSAGGILGRICFYFCRGLLPLPSTSGSERVDGGLEDTGIYRTLL